MGRSPCCSKEGLNRGAWTAQEDRILTEYIRVHGEGKWGNLPKRAGLKRCGKSCRLRWLNYLRPDIKRGNISPDEEELIIRLHKLLGNRWSLIAGRLPGRTDNEIKNYWNTNLGKRVQNNQTSTAPPPKINSQVVWTKAVKCSKVVINTPQTNDTGAVGVLSTEGHHHSLTKPVDQSTTTTYNGLLSFSVGEDNPSSDFMMNFNMRDICLSDLLNSDFSDICDFNCSGDNKNDLSASSDHQALMLPEEILQDWDTSNCVQSDVAPILRSFTSLVDSEGEWLGKY